MLLGDQNAGAKTDSSKVYLSRSRVGATARRLPAPFSHTGTTRDHGTHSLTDEFLAEIGHLILMTEDRQTLKEHGRLKGQYRDDEARIIASS